MSDIEFTIENDVAILTLNRPAQRNAMKLSMWRALAQHGRELANRRDVRAVILTGAGSHFCSGADISEFASIRDNKADAQVYAAAVDDAQKAIGELSKPVIAAVDGFCVGGGCGLALACDFRIASDSARFAITAAKLGLVYGDRETRNLFLAVGLSYAKRILFSAERLTAEDALKIGLIDEIANAPAIARAKEFAASMARNAPLSIAGSKLILRALAEGGDPASPEIQAATDAAIESADYKEGRRAFAEKRPPRFTGQ